MKKIFLPAVIIAALFFAACANLTGKGEGQQEEPKISEKEQAFVRDVLAGFNEDMPEMNGDGLTFREASVEGHNFICAFTVDEALFGGTPMKKAFAEAGMDEASFASSMKQLMFADMTQEDKIIFSNLKVYKYNLVYRLIGNLSGDQMDCMIHYQEFPK